MSTGRNNKRKLVVEAEDDGEDTAEYWKKRFEALQRETDEQLRDLEKQIQLSAESESKLKRYSALLDQKVKTLERKLQETQQAPTEADAATATATATELIAFYDRMTSMSVSLSNEVFTCTVKNAIKRQATVFTISSDKEKDLIHFHPTVNIDMLPEYLRAQIAFEPNMAPVLMGDILQSLYEEES